MSNCNVCLKRVLMQSYNLTCDICNSSVHVKCLPCVNNNDPLFTKRHKNIFHCSLCLRDIFAFNHLDDDEFIEAISESWENRPLVSFDMLDNQGLIFSPFDLNDKYDNPLHYVDPDIQFIINITRYHCNPVTIIVRKCSMIRLKNANYLTNLSPH